MIQIRRKRGRIEIDGHAGAGPYGHDVVCAAISALVQTLVCSLEELTGDEFYSDLRQGYAVIEYNEGQMSRSGRILIESFFVGVYGVASAAPDNVVVIEGNGAEPNIPGGIDKAARKIREDQEETHEEDYQRDETLPLQPAAVC